LSFDGVDDYLVITHEINLSIAKHSLSLWLKIASRGTRAVIMKDKHQGENYSIWTNDNLLQSQFYHNSGLSKVRSNDKLLDEFYNIVVTYNGSNLKIFSNSTLENQIVATSLPTTDFEPLYIGFDGGYGYGKFHGLIDDVRIYDRALSAEEVQALYNLGQ
jgi:hypothetical protein